MSAYPLGKMIGVVGGGQLGRMMVRPLLLLPRRERARQRRLPATFEEHSAVHPPAAASSC